MRPRRPDFGPVSYLLGLAYVGMLLVLPLWFMRLLFQTHECINHPMAALRGTEYQTEFPWAFNQKHSGNDRGRA